MNEGIERTPRPGGAEAEPFRVPPADSLDLHTFRPADVAGVVDEYLRDAARRGRREVRIIHGKGTGFQREIVRGVLEKHPAVASFRLAPAERGHWGATIVTLRGDSAGGD